MDVVRRAAMWFDPAADGLAPLVDFVGDARFVLIGEATHGTHEFYRTRAELTRALITEKAFNVVAIEADWPAAYRVNRWVRGASADRTAGEALGDFHRFPRWMWRNTDVVEFVAWLQRINASRPPAARVGFYGLDLYSLHASIEAVLEYLDKVDPAAAARTRERYACFESFGGNSQAYGYAASFGLSPSCQDEVVAQLVDLRRRAGEYATSNGWIATDDSFFAEQNARLVRDAEQYYRSMFGGQVESWNLRDTHMRDTLEALVRYVHGTSGHARAIVWAHNSHLGDARATDMGTIGELNLGQLVRQAHGRAARSIGFTTHTGLVTAASNWDEPPQRKRIRPSLEGSYERLFHDTGIDRFMLFFDEPDVRDALTAARLERAIGVIYRPETERDSHYFRARLPDQFDAVLHVDATTALTPLESWSRDEADLPETFPSAL